MARLDRRHAASCRYLRHDFFLANYLVCKKKTDREVGVTLLERRHGAACRYFAV